MQPAFVTITICSVAWKVIILKLRTFALVALVGIAVARSENRREDSDEGQSKLANTS